MAAVHVRHQPRTEVNVQQNPEDGVKIVMLHRFEFAVGGVRQPQHTQTSSKSSTIASDSSNGVTNTRCCRYSCMRSWWWVEVTPETCRAVSNKLCNSASCWIYIGILLGAHPILHISRLRVNVAWYSGTKCFGFRQGTLVSWKWFLQPFQVTLHSSRSSRS
jgi:hypothetical protein